MKISWNKYENNPVLGGDLGTCFDICVLKENETYLMYFSWRPKISVALVKSVDGINWTEPVIVLGPCESGWEDKINRPYVIYRDGVYHMWYTGQTVCMDKDCHITGHQEGTSQIGYSFSKDGINFERLDKPVLVPDLSWEKSALMCPSVIYDEELDQYMMWYSGGEQYEPDAIGLAVSKDGINFNKIDDSPLFTSSKQITWEQEKVTACHVIKYRGYYVMFYLGFEDVHTSRIGIARSKNGMTNWERLINNPILSPEPGMFDADACYKPHVIREKDKWMLWYNGRTGKLEQIGLAYCSDANLGFKEW